MSDSDFRWRSFFQSSSEPLFVLNRQRYILHVNAPFEQLTRLAAQQLRLARHPRFPVPLVGAAGTGKETLARLIHYRGPRREQSFACLDCRRLPPFALTTLLWGDSGTAARAPLGAVYLKEPGALPR